jgi:Xaa-Pro aminopeptidase
VSFLRQSVIDAYIVPHEDEFLTEYVPNHSERLSFITGFTGSAGLSNNNKK